LWAAAWIVGKDQAPNIPQLKGARWFSFEEIRQCTSSFSRDNEIGGGGYGKVKIYKSMIFTRVGLGILPYKPRQT
jgi:hypothetical protein